MKCSIVTSVNDIYKLLLEFDNCFNPSLSKIIKNLHDYSVKLFNNAIVFKLINGKTDIGFAAIYCNDLETKNAYISQICVNKSGNGYGQYLMDIIVDYCKSKGMKNIRLEVYNNNKIALKFYKKNGFIYENNAKSKETSYYIKEI